MRDYPGLVVFDLDFTLWDCGGTWCDCLSPPFRSQSGNLVDRDGRIVSLYQDVHSILDQCDQVGTVMALASRTEQPSWARTLIERLGVRDRFQFAEIYPSSKLKHFGALREASDVDYEDMLFFDDETRNIVEVQTLGVTAIHVARGMSMQVFEDGLDRWRGRRDNH
ncbi:MAG: magnesium-dependent phosphatase-1 [Planctomycetota bacterium]